MAETKGGGMTGEDVVRGVAARMKEVEGSEEAEEGREVDFTGECVMGKGEKTREEEDEAVAECKAVSNCWPWKGARD
jgi:hypothetical protein